MSTFARYFHTIRYLRPVQIAGRVWYRAHRPRPDLRPAPKSRELGGTYATPIASPPTLIAPDVFRFLNVERQCSTPQDWNSAEATRLWIYNLHYFDDLNSVAAADRRAWHQSLLERWVGENPPGTGAGWEPYPVSKRIVNWVKWAAAGNRLSRAAQDSLAVQARWLSRRLEYHILGNHLFANAKALVHAGLYFAGEEAARWYAHGLDILRRELKEQVLADGGHFELSTLYHAAALEDLLDLINLLRAYGCPAPAGWQQVATGMHHWLARMTHPDGGISFFNDAAFGIAPTLAELDAYARRLDIAPPANSSEPLCVLESSGYLTATVPGAYLVCDCADIGPDYLVGHAHADTLSFELSLADQRLLVNSGTSEYGTAAERQRQRGTAAHNTVVVDGQDSSEVWAGFRVARRARAQLCSTSAGGPIVIEARHDGYRRLPGRNVHTRRWTLKAGALEVEDRISGKFGTAEAYFHLHPAVRADHSGTSEVTMTHPHGARVRVAFTGAAQVQVRPSTWHPEFGRVVANQLVAVRFAGPVLTTRLCWD